MMRSWLCGVALVTLAAPASAAPCRLVGAPWLEARVGSGKLQRQIDARLGETIDVFVAAPGELRGRRVVFGDSGAGRVPFATVKDACGEATIAWQRVEPLMEHTHTPSPNSSVTVYANAVVFGPKHGTWIGFDKIEYVETPLSIGGPVAHVTSARPSEVVGPPDRDEARADLGVMRLAATVTLAGSTVRTPGSETARGSGQIGDGVFRYTIRDGDGFLGWLSSYFNVPYLFGSAGKGERAQASRYIGADCADVLVAALRRTGYHIEYSSVAELVDSMRRVAGPVELAECKDGTACKVTALRFGSEVAPGDFLAIDYISFDGLPRAWDHIVAVVADSGPDGKADGVLGPDDLVADIGDASGLKLTPLSHHGHVRIAVLRPIKQGYSPTGGNFVK